MSLYFTDCMSCGHLGQQLDAQQKQTRALKETVAVRDAQIRQLREQLAAVTEQRDAMATIKADLYTRIDAHIVDVREIPSSWNGQYRQAALLRRFPDRYAHYPALGNPSRTPDAWPNRQSEIAQRELDMLAVYLTYGGMDLVLLCAESDHRKCHRRFVAEALAELVPDLTIIHL